MPSPRPSAASAPGADPGAARGPRSGPSRRRAGGRRAPPTPAQGIQRIGLSATQRPLERIAQFLVGPKRECEIVDAGQRKELDLEIVVPVEDMADPGAPAYPSRTGPADRSRAQRPCPLDLAGDLPGALELVQEHTSTIIFVNNRRAAERLAKRLNELANGEGEQELPATEHAGHGASSGGVLRRATAGRLVGGPARSAPYVEIARAHHGSLAHEERPWSRRC